jgi:chorismate mutase / prephenate dehydratase
MSLDELRRQVDALDERILELLSRRALVVRDIAAAKQAAQQPAYDAERERAVLERLEQLAAQAASPLPAESVRVVFREIMSACLSVDTPLAVAYFGPPGTHTHMAARAAFGLTANYVDAGTIPGVFEAVVRGRVQFGVAPIENSTEGGVTFTLDSLVEHDDVRISGELVLDVTQCLVGLTEDLGQIQRVYSHPQALAQCRNWLAKNLPRAQLVVSLSTSTAAREAAGDPAAAAICSRLAAELTGLKVVRDRVQDRDENATRFIILSNTDAAVTGRDKTSLFFSTPHQRGALRKALEIFDQEGINLTRIESRPAPEKRWEYVFFVDLEGHRTDPAVARALERLGGASAMVRIIGSYPRAPG